MVCKCHSSSCFSVPNASRDGDYVVVMSEATDSNESVRVCIHSNYIHSKAVYIVLRR